MTSKLILIAALFPFAYTASAEQIYISARTGNDINAGTQSQPLRTLLEAARRVNTGDKKESTTIILSEGVYMLNETVLFNNNKYSRENRLIIRAEVMPDDTGWHPQRMPILVSSAPTLPDGDGEIAKGIDIEASHVTIEGLRFSGTPEYYYIDGKHNRRTYPVWRGDDTLNDLLVSQCLFTGDVDIAPVRVAVIAKGHGFVIDHCVFYHCQNPVVFWSAADGTSRNNAMRYCLAYGCYYSGVWTTKETGEDFEFHHNIITGGGTSWVHEGTRSYKASNCIISNNANQASIGNDATGVKTPGALDFLQMENVRLSGTVEIEKDQARKNYLQLKAGSFGSELGAGLFKK